MQRRLTILGLGVAAVLGLLWALGALEGLRLWAEAGQREVQNALAGAVRRLRAGEAGALAALLAVGFGYGFFHAVGPGHGKLLIGSYGVARRVRLLPLAVIALASSLAQAAVAVGLVYGFVFALGWTRERVEGMTVEVMAPISYAAIAGIGLWLVLRGVRGLHRQALAVAAVAPGGGHEHHHDATCGCGHVHGPSAEQVAGVASFRDAALLVAGVAMRPCSGALFLLILTWKMGIAAAGIAGVFAMGLGTALVTIVVAALSVWAREGALASLPGAGVARALPLLELAAGALVALVSVQLLVQSL
ncbi:MAG TPA: hypothetical protein VGA75_12125 [Paracoccaceae bacterium]